MQPPDLYDVLLLRIAAEKIARQIAWAMTIFVIACGPIGVLIAFSSKLEWYPPILLIWSWLCLRGGSTMNRCVMRANGNLMPVCTKNPKMIALVEKSERHRLAESHTRLKALCDWIDDGMERIHSPGDLLIDAGRCSRGFAFIYAVIFCALSWLPLFKDIR